ncbi:MAG: hypothetical protein ACR2F8_07050 [Caulobacteraceae bacterium]
MSGPPLIVVHQMAKVGSLAWVEAARSAAGRGGSEPLHAHYLTETNLAAFEAILAAKGAANTILHPLVARLIPRNGRKAAGEIAAARARGQPVKVITGMRDPVARSLSVAGFLADFCGRAGGALSARDGADAAAVVAFVGDLWEAVLADAEPAGSFERLAWRMVGAYRTWFDEELAAVFGLDLLAARLPPGAPWPAGGGARRLSAAGVELLAYRAEDMGDGAPGRPALLAAGAAFLETPGVALPALNTAATRRSWPLYAETRARFRLPAAQLAAIYAAPAVRAFYAPEEIAGFKARWSA